MTIRIIINGANGKMGQLAVKTLKQDHQFTVVGELGRNDNLTEEIKKNEAQVVLDLTNADAVFKNAQSIIKTGVCPVIGTSGLLKDQVNELQKLCTQQKIGGIIAPNFSLGAVLMMKYAQQCATYFPEVEIIEMHHNTKLDSPSGTAVRTAELLAASRTKLPALQSHRETITGARGARYEQIPIHSIRLPGLVAHQQIIFGNAGETLTFRHDTIDRQCFMPGVLLACKKVTELKELIYGLENVLA